MVIGFLISTSSGAAETFPRSVMDLPDERMTADRTCAEVIRAMADPHRGTMHGPFVGITMMGPGADQIFARVLLETGGHLCGDADVRVPVP